MIGTHRSINDSASHRRSTLFLVWAVTLVLAGCGEILEVEVDLFPDSHVSLSTRTYIETSSTPDMCSAPTPEVCETNLTIGAGPGQNVRWVATPIDVEAPADTVEIEVEQLLPFPPACTDTEPLQQTQPGGCIYKSSVKLPLGTWRFTAHKDSPLDSWRTSCEHELILVAGEVPTIAVLEFREETPGCIFDDITLD